jgi:phenylpropionate dioxygenase-like ring-hydroxylating dioxygenase large terminal subunit
VTTLDESRTASAQIDPYSAVNAEEGTIDRSIFVDPTVFRQEMEQLFARAWLFVGHESQIPQPGDYFVSRMGTDSVILTRDAQGEIHVLLNSCRHRGMKVCRYDIGNTLQFTCPYHGWSYSVDGSLVSRPGDLFGVPQFKAAYGGKLDRSRWGLVSVPRMHNYRGFIFASWDREAASFEEYIGDFRHWLDSLSDSMTAEAGQVEVFAGVLKWRVRANWKFVAENFLGDMYHAATSHSSAEAAGIGPTGVGSRHGLSPEEQVKRRARQHSTSFTLLGHGATDAADEERPSPVFEGHPELTEYFAEQSRIKHERRVAQGRPLGAHGPATLFPSMSFHASGFPRTILAAHPVSPTETEMWRWFLVDKAAPDNVREWLRHYYMRYSGPGGLTEQDDMENWNYATDASSGTIARRYRYHYGQGLGMNYPASVAGATESDSWSTEENARNFYRRWARFVAGENWQQLMTEELT